MSLQEVDIDKILDELMDLHYAAKYPLTEFEEDNRGTRYSVIADSYFRSLREHTRRVDALLPEDIDLAACNMLVRDVLRRLRQTLDELREVFELDATTGSLAFPIGDPFLSQIHHSIERLQKHGAHDRSATHAGEHRGESSLGDGTCDRLDEATSDEIEASAENNALGDRLEEANSDEAGASAGSLFPNGLSPLAKQMAERNEWLYVKRMGGATLRMIREELANKRSEQMKAEVRPWHAIKTDGGVRYAISRHIAAKGLKPIPKGKSGRPKGRS